MLIEAPLFARMPATPGTVGEASNADRNGLQESGSRHRAENRPECEACEGRAAGAMIGPNAILQSVEVMLEAIGERQTRAILDDAQITALPSGEHMIPEIEAIRLHRWLALHEPADSFRIAAESGRRTADYIMANRIPKAAVWLLQHLPARLAAPMLMAAIRRHAWTFIGAGQFETEGAWHFTIDRSHANDPILPPDTLFHWYSAVFTRLYRKLVHPSSRCTDTGAPDEAPLQHHFALEIART